MNSGNQNKKLNATYNCSKENYLDRNLNKSYEEDHHKILMKETVTNLNIGRN